MSQITFRPAWDTLTASLALFGLLLLHPAGASAAPSKEVMQRGQQHYVRNCLACHQFTGQGTAGAFPPLAKSDFLVADRERAIRILCDGISSEIVVNGKTYAGSMPPAILNDTEVAEVLTYVLNSWGNDGGEVSAGDVKPIREKTSFPTFEKLQAAGSYAPLPKPPAGFTLREVVRLNIQPTRMVSDGKGDVIYLLAGAGDVWRLEPKNGALRQILFAAAYLEKRPGDMGLPINVCGMALDKKGRLYMAANQQNNATLPLQNLVTIYRSTSKGMNGDPADMKPWFQTNYPGNVAYMHGMENLAFGPDGLLYAGNGARTDANQPGDGPNDYKGGETPITSSIWRFNPDDEKPRLEIYARGIRNAYGFCWNDQGEMFATENGPDAPANEELNQIVQGKHYGFPYTFADWTKKAYRHTPDAPAGQKFELPIANLGPDGGYAGKPTYTFDPHSCPGGIVFLGPDFPEGWRGTYLLTRFGNFIKEPKDNVGFDLLQAKLKKNDQGRYEANIYTVLAPLGRPIDVHLAGEGKIYICEYTRPTNNQLPFALPGRILELAVQKP